MPVAIDADFVGSNDQYNGFSDALVIGDGLVEIHSYNNRLPKAAVEQAGLDEYMLISYTRADPVGRVPGEVLTAHNFLVAEFIKRLFHPVEIPLKLFLRSFPGPVE